MKILFLFRKFAKEIIIALILAFIAGVVIEKYLDRNKTIILSENSEAIATIISLDRQGNTIATGSGIFLDSKGKLVTNYHVVSRAYDVQAKLPSGAYYRLKDVVGVSPEYDIIILQFDAKGTPFARIGDSVNIKVGEKVFTIGSPMGLEATVGEGIISYPKRKYNGVELIQFTAPISPGSSGGVNPFLS